jgi:hypothetical protein
MKDRMKRFSDGLRLFLASRGFLIFILAFFIFESGWIALSAAYPQAFDENFHFGLIQIYSHYWLPFLSSQPAHANAYGAVARDPSYLYHYLMSFPYRFIQLFVHSQTGQVIWLRFINILLFAWAIILFRKVLLRVGTSRSLANFALLLFCLIPIVPQLAAQINYDNLIIPLIAWVILLTFSVTDQIRSRKLSIVSLVGLASLCLLASLVKYAFLPIFLAVVVFLAGVVIINYKKALGHFFLQLGSSWKQQSGIVRALLIGLVLLSAGMFIQRDGVNLIKYHNIAPNCAVVLNTKDCNAYSVWSSDYTRHQQLQTQLKAGTFKYMNPLTFLLEWVYWMWYRLFFAVNGPVSGFTNYPPLPLPSAAAIVIVLIGLFCIIKWWHKIFHRNSHLIFLAITCAIYIVALVMQGYSSYRYTGILENMNGRYLLPIILLMAAIFARAIALALRKATTAKALISVFVLILFLQGGGFITFITRSDDTWYFQNTVVTKANNDARKIINPVVLNGEKQYSTSYWFFN